MQSKFRMALIKAIECVEEENDYEFTSIEIDNVLLDILKRRHSEYLVSEFGETTI